jgi:hypothetical protein
MAQKKKKRLKSGLRNLLIATAIVIGGVILYNIIFEIRIWYINRSELSDIEEVDKHSAAVFKKFIEEIEDKTDWNVSIISGYRSKKEQIQLKRDNPQNAASNKSRHVLGRAIDINLYKRSGLRRVWLKKGSSKSDWRRSGVTAIAAKYNLLWGGSYKYYHDPVHFEIH